MTSATTQCPERVAPETLAAWRDGTLPAAEVARLDTHIPECPACRAALSTYEAQDVALRRYPAPEPDERLWHAVRERIGTGHRSPHTAGRMRPRRLAGGLGALAAVVLLSLGFAQVLRSRVPASVRTSPTATVSGTPTPLPTAVPASPAVPGPRPNWQQAQLPVSPLSDQDILTFAVVPGHGESAYACHAISGSNGATLTFYRTADRALHWTQLTQVTVPHLDASDCMVQVDALDGSRVLIQVRGQDMQTFKDAMWYDLSEDGGKTWTRLDQSAPISDLATIKGTTYALRQVVEGQTYVAVLSASTDHLRTWQSIDQSLVGPDQMVTNFWLNPDGELMVQVETTSGAPASATPSNRPNTMPVRMSVALWRSTDGGAHWSPFPAPVLTSDGVEPHFTVQAPAAGQPWHICAPYTPQGSSSASLACTYDGGHTWSTRPLLCIAAPCASSSQATSDSGQYFLASDGAVLDMALAPGSDSQLALYRLPPNATTWQYLGPIAGSNAYFFAPTPTGGVLWAFAGGEYAARLSGSIGGHQALPGVLATATYP